MSLMPMSRQLGLSEAIPITRKSVYCKKLTKSTKNSKQLKKYRFWAKKVKFHFPITFRISQNGRNLQNFSRFKGVGADDRT